MLIESIQEESNFIEARQILKPKRFVTDSDTLLCDDNLPINNKRKKKMVNQENINAKQINQSDLLKEVFS